MEELVGRWWHQTLLRVTAPRHAAHAVHLTEMQKPIGVLFRAAGGAHSLRVVEATAQRTGGQRHWLHRVAGSGERAALPVLEPQVLALPPTLDVFADVALNRDLYAWLALLSAHFDEPLEPGWIARNRRATQRTLQAFPGFVDRYRRLCQAHLAQRPMPAKLRGPGAPAERAVQTALCESMSQCPAQADVPQPDSLGSERSSDAANFESCAAAKVSPCDVAPVWLWLVPGAGHAQFTARQAAATTPADVSRQPSAQDAKRRRAKAATSDSARNALILPFRGEALMSWTEMVRVDRATDDEDDGTATKVADDMDQLSVAGEGQSLAARVKFDLDLPSSSADDLPLGAGQPFPEWDYQRGVLRPAHCAVQEMLTRQTAPFTPSLTLRKTARQLRRRLEVLRDAPRPQHAQDSGDDIDLDAWVRLAGEATQPRSDQPAVYTWRVRSERSLATLLLADLSQSTDAYANQQQRVIDVIRDALYVFGEGLSAVGDPFAMWGFSSVRRQQVRLQQLKRFDERWDDAIRSRVRAIRPGYYTRMGAALRHATQQLGARPERKRLLMLLTDGKPNDLDQYEGRYGLEDTRHAVQQARAAGLTPFCITIDAAAHDYLPMLFGRQGFCLVHRPQDLVQRLTQAWTLLAR